MHKKLYLSLLTLIVFVVIVLLFAGNYLVRNDGPYRGDAMVILMGSVADRVLEASDLYHEGYADRVLIAEEGMGPVELLRKRGATLITNSTQARNVAIELGVPGDSILILPGNAQSTLMEARIIADYLHQNPQIDTLLLVTAPPHTRRAGWIFEKTMKKSDLKVTIICKPAKYHQFKGKGWYKRKEDTQSVMYEYLKLAAFLFVEQFR
jgi:uncharacterized SAM-binding protein YcdF (DUF218 family)